MPRFVVLDETHNLIPAEPKSVAADILRDDFRRIAAEGRKFGLFLIFISQRPDKLDPLIFSECENKVVMRLALDAVVETTRRMLGLDDVPELEACREFGPGRARLIGKWSNYKPKVIYGAARRTKEGGRNLDPAHWAVPFTVSRRAGRRDT